VGRSGGMTSSRSNCLVVRNLTGVGCMVGGRGFAYGAETPVEHADDYFYGGGYEGEIVF
jgi:hypothetical protein